MSSGDEHDFLVERMLDGSWRMNRVWTVSMKERALQAVSREQEAQSMERGLRGAQFSLSKSTTSPGVPNMNLMLCWDLSIGRRDSMLETTVGWAGWNQDMTGGPWRESKHV